ncbi:Hypothetical_protein [Hexamita inflata]|uniref:Hypothetical_protein n=1 Tax=Hexamita inflata TaxID=28002 RepID=A0AA86R7X2_9EUKA|nr:Hypothetical protein HINF_LOCUS56561 [Hexamita inflata]
MSEFTTEYLQSIVFERKKVDILHLVSSISSESGLSDEQVLSSRESHGSNQTCIFSVQYVLFTENRLRILSVYYFSVYYGKINFIRKNVNLEWKYLIKCQHFVYK